MTAVVITNLLFSMLVVGGVVGLLAHAIHRDRMPVRRGPSPRRARFVLRRA
jgi:hypothetical protein